MFTAIGSMFGPIGTVVGALTDTALAMDQQQRSNRAKKQAYEQNKKDASNKFVDLRNAAQKAGFNPLTALRATGGVGFGSYGAPVLSKQTFAATFGKNLAKGYLDSKETPIDKYNAQIRDLEIKERMARIDNTIASTAGMLSRKKVDDPYAGYAEKIPVRFGHKSFSIPIEIAKRAGIEPNNFVTPGEIAELFGEGSELVTNFALEAQRLMYGTTAAGLSGGDTKPKAPWLDGFRQSISDAIDRGYENKQRPWGKRGGFLQ